MKTLNGACLIGQSGGPTAVINAAALGAIQTALKSEYITRVLGARYGIEGILNENLIDLGQESAAELELLKYTPAAALGSCRYKMKDPQTDASDYQTLLEVFKKYDIRYFFYIGGNDSMDTCNKVSKFLQQENYECRVVGIPKTIDNDLAGTDHCPGYGSAAKFIATACMEIKEDLNVYKKGRVTIVEIMGRHAGWLAGAAALATHAGMGPDLIYLPEVPFNLDTFLADTARIYQEQGNCMVAVSEGLVNANGQFVAETADKDVFGHSQLGGLGGFLANVVKEKLGIKVRAVELSLLQRCAAHLAALTDVEESYAAGQFAVTQALLGASDTMVAFERETSEGQAYQCRLKLVNLSHVANFEKLVPRAWINSAGNGMEPPFIQYAMPLIQGIVTQSSEQALPRFARLKAIPAKPYFE